MSNLAAVYTARATPLVIKELDIPKPKTYEVLVKTAAVASNPVDFKIVKYGLIIDFFPVTLGSDAVGVVQEVGDSIKHVQKGDRVISMMPVFGKIRNLKTGAFQQYILSPYYAVVKLPDSISFDRAVTLCLGPGTVAITLFHYFKLPRPASSEKQPITEDSPVMFINGGATAVGHAGIQIARMMGYKVITTASPKNFDMLFKIGANEVFDYHDDDWASKVKEAAGKPIHLVIDAVTSVQTVPLCYQVISPPGKIALMNFIKKEAPPKDVNVYPIWAGLLFEPSHVELFSWWLHFLVKATEIGHFITLEPLVFGHSIADVQKLIDFHGSGQVSAVKPIILLDQ